jgi:hypothetical protein
MFDLQRRAGNRATSAVIDAQHRGAPLVRTMTLQRAIRFAQPPGAAHRPAPITTEAQVQALFRRNDVHYYYKYHDDIANIVSAQSPVFADEAEAVVWILDELHVAEGERASGQTTTLAPGTQDIIQKKLVEIAELFRSKTQQTEIGFTTHEEGTGEFEDDGEEITKTVYDDPVTEWYRRLGIDGLCGGWAAVHRRRPKWFEQLWQAIEAWTPTEGRSAEAELHDLERYLKERLGDDLGDDPIEDVVTMLTGAWQFMGQLEPHNYGPVPKAFPTAEWQPHKRSGRPKKVVEVTYGDAGKEIVAAIAALVKNEKQGDYIAHVETAAHHMSARVGVSSGGKLTGAWRIVESEHLGVVTTSDQREIYRAFRDGVFLAGPDERTQEVEVSAYRGIKE